MSHRKEPVGRPTRVMEVTIMQIGFLTIKNPLFTILSVSYVHTRSLVRPSPRCKPNYDACTIKIQTEEEGEEKQANQQPL
jgi:hypothetical protein